MLIILLLVVGCEVDVTVVSVGVVVRVGVVSVTVVAVVVLGAAEEETIIKWIQLTMCHVVKLNIHHVSDGAIRYLPG